MITLAGQGHKFRHFIDALVRRNLALLLLVTGHLVAAVLTAKILSIPFEPSFFGFLTGLFLLVLPFFVLAVVSWRLIVIAVKERPDSPIRALGGWILVQLTDKERMSDGVLALLLISAFVAGFSYFKAIIPQINPFSWDPAFAELDRVLHFGHNPYELLLPLLGSPFMTTLVNAAYHGWLFLMYFVVFLACFTRIHLRSRMTFLLSFVLTWAVGGNVLAILFSSAGPVYFERMGYGDDFVPLMQALRSAAEVSPVWALEVHEMLWGGYAGDEMAAGISAMPSMHLASATLMTLYAWRHARWLGVIMGLFTLVMLLGSVHLAWHYAVDSYAGILIAVGIWWVVSWLQGPTVGPGARHTPAPGF